MKNKLKQLLLRWIAPDYSSLKKEVEFLRKEYSTLSSEVTTLVKEEDFESMIYIKLKYKTLWACEESSWFGDAKNNNNYDGIYNNLKENK